MNKKEGVSSRQTILRSLHLPTPLVIFCLLLLLFLFCFVLFFITGFLYSFGAYPGIPSVDQAGLELTEIFLPLPPEF